MRVTLLGTGTPAPNPERMQSAVLIAVGDDRLLVDAGRGVVHQMGRLGTPIGDVGPVFITHHHADHINDLFDVIITSALAGRTQPLSIYGPPGTAAIVDALLTGVYARDIRSRIADVENQRAAGLAVEWDTSLLSAVDCHDIGPGTVCRTASYAVTAAEVLHGRYPTDATLDWYCLAYRVDTPDASVVISGDTVPCDGIIDLARDADLLVQCCHFPLSSASDPHVAFMTRDTLPTSRQAGEIAAGANVRHVVLTHLSARLTADELGTIQRDVAGVFDGAVTIGHDLMSFDLTG